MQCFLHVTKPSQALSYGTKPSQYWRQEGSCFVAFTVNIVTTSSQHLLLLFLLISLSSLPSSQHLLFYNLLLISLRPSQHVLHLLLTSSHLHNVFHHVLLIVHLHYHLNFSYYSFIHFLHLFFMLRGRYSTLGGIPDALCSILGELILFPYFLRCVSVI